MVRAHVAAGPVGNQTRHSKLLLECGASPPPLANTIRVAAQGHTYAFLRVPFGWHRAPGLVQALISDLLGDLGRGVVVVVQYLDDILFVGHDPGEVAAVTDSAAHLLRRAGFIISEKSVFTPQRSLRWMGKDVDLRGRRVAPAASAVAAVVAAWVRLALKPYTYVALRRLLGKLGWLGRPGNLGGCFLAGARSWLRWGPRWAWRTPPAVVRGLCEAMAQCYRGWEPDTTSAGPAVRVHPPAPPPLPPRSLRRTAKPSSDGSLKGRALYLHPLLNIFMFTMRAHLRSDFHLTNTSAFASPPHHADQALGRKGGHEGRHPRAAGGGEGIDTPPRPAKLGVSPVLPDVRRHRHTARVAQPARRELHSDARLVV